MLKREPCGVALETFPMIKILVEALELSSQVWYVTAKYVADS